MGVDGGKFGGVAGVLCRDGVSLISPSVGNKQFLEILHITNKGRGERERVGRG